MPREQLTNYKYARPANDVRGMGATIYTALTGRCPRECKPERDPIQAVLSEEIVPLRRWAPGVPETVAAVIERALAPDPSERFESAADFREALAHVAG